MVRIRPSIAAALCLLGLAARDLPAQSFQQSTYGVGTDPSAVVIADFDLDGRLDLAVANRGSNKVSVLWGYGGVFAPPFSFVVGWEPVAILAADFDNDGYPDLATANRGSGTVSLARGRGDGTFHVALGYPCGDTPVSLEAADLDGDGNLDVLVAMDSTDTPIAWLPGTGTGALGSPRAIDGGWSATAVRCGDLDGQPGLDVVALNANTSTVRLYHGSGSGTFSLMDVLPAPAIPRGLVVTDLGGDGWLDLVVAGGATGSLNVYRGTGAGAFAAPLTLPTVPSPTTVIAGDIDGDQRCDLTVISGSTGALSTLKQTADGGFVPAPLLPTGLTAAHLGLADLDRDYVNDVVAVSDSANAISVHLNDAGPWIDLGLGMLGDAGTLALGGTGDTTPGQSCEVQLSVAQPGVESSSLGWLLAGQASAQQPFLGGTLVPVPQTSLLVSSQATLPFTWPSSMPAGSSVYLQGWFPSAASDGMVSATNAVRVIVLDD